MFDISEFQGKLDQLVSKDKMSAHTRDYYVSALKTLNKKCTSSANKKSPAELERLIHQICKGNSQYGKYLSAVSKYEQLVVGRERSLLYGEPLVRLNQLRPNAKGVEPRLPESTYMRKINRLNNPHMKIALRLEAKSGLRIAELAALQKQDIQLMDDGEIHLRVRSGKGGKSRAVQVIQDPYLCEKLQKHLESLSDGDRVIPYSLSYLKKKACEHNIPTHDLRRINAKTRFRGELEQGKGRRAARRSVAKQLGHSDVATTNLYLGSEWHQKNQKGGESISEQ